MKDLQEAGLIVRRKEGAYPTSGQVLILAGGAGSGKGHVVKNVLLFQGRTFNVDDLKEKLKNLAKVKPNCRFATLFKKKYGYDLSSLDFKDGQQVKDLHFFIKSLGLPDAEKMAFFANAKLMHEKPNVIFDVTLDEIKKLREFSYYAQLGGYDKKDINIVWVLTDIEVAKKQNATRPRTVPQDLLVTTHEGAAMTMFELIANSQKYQKYMDGDIWIVLNTAGIDSRLTTTQSTGLTQKRDDTVVHIDTDVKDGHRGYLAIHVKSKGEPSKKFAQLEPEFRQKILKYIPKTV